MAIRSDAYRNAEAEGGIPPVSERGRTNGNPTGIGFWALVAEDFRTHERKLFEQGFWAIFWHRFGNWRMDQPKLIRAPSTLLYNVMFKANEVLSGISLWYTTKLGRRVRIWHHSGMVLGARAIGDECQIRQNTTFGVGQTGVNDDLPIIGARVDIGAGACIAGAVHIGDDAKIGGNALVVTDVPAGATVMGNPAQVVIAPRSSEPEPSETSKPVAPMAPAVSAAPVPMRAEPLDMGRIALLGSANLDYLAMSFAEAATRFGLHIETVVPEFGTARMELLAAPENSRLQREMQAPLTATLVVERAEDVLGDVAGAPLSLAAEDVDAYLDQALEPMLQTIRSAREKLKGPLLVLSLAAVQAPSLGLADAAGDRGRSRLIRRANEMLAAALEPLADTSLIDGEAVVAEVGRAAAAPGALWHMGRLPFSEPFNTCLARKSLGALLALRGKTARLLVLDLDNTLWGGVLGEDGPEGVAIGGAYPGSAYKEFQAALRALSDRGIALAVASKNDEDLALEMIADHPEMVLRPSDFVALRINWTEKALNIQDMLAELSLGAGSTMFIDDNPVEREKVRKNLPDCIVPEFPSAPEDLAEWLLANPFLECLELTASDLKRSAQYKVRAEVNAARRSFESIEEFYRDLDMQLTFEAFGAMNQQRVLQLFVKTNQFNTTTRRHDAAAVAQILETGGEVFAVGVRDRHSEYELMGVLALRPDAAMAAAYPEDAAIQSVPRDAGAWWVDSFLMSCRILGRTVENAVLAWATQELAGRGATALIGQVIETPRNTPARKVFEASGFTPHEDAAGLWVRRLDEPISLPEYFTVVQAETNPETHRMRTPRKRLAPPVPPAATDTPRSSPAGVGIRATDPTFATRLQAIFHRLFGLPPDADLSSASMDTVPAWDSLGHLKLSMEIEREFGIRLSGEEIGRIRSYSDLLGALDR